MIIDFLKLGLNNLMRRKLRSWLTMIGIFIGIAAVVSLISLGQGLQNSVNQQFEQLGRDKIIIQPKTLGAPGSSSSKDLILTTEDLDTIKNVNGVEKAAGMLSKTASVKFREQLNIVFVIGIEPDDQDVLEGVQSYHAEEGRLLKSGDKFKVVAGNNHIFGNLWSHGLKIKNNVEILGQSFSIVGVFKKVGNPFDDNAIYMPKETMRQVFNLGNEESQIIVKVSSEFEPGKVADDIKRKLRKERGEKEGEETFDVQTSEQLLQTFQNVFGVIQSVLVGIAAISLLVGGIGIMNTMYTSVLERTKEIGTMKAIGATNNQILLLFLFESGLLGLVGGFIGTGIGIGLAKTAEYFAAQALGSDLLKASMNPLIFVGALSFSFVIGSLSGLLPARQAAGLKPVDALRWE
ncbi:MAG: ABC transporter permease [archaeon]